MNRILRVIDGLLFLRSGFAQTFDFLNDGDWIVGGFLDRRLSLPWGLRRARWTPVREMSTSNQVAAAGNFINLVNVDNPMLGQLNIAISLSDQVPDQIFHIATYIAGFTEFSWHHLLRRAR